jgi:hypothetical protein
LSAWRSLGRIARNSKGCQVNPGLSNLKYHQPVAIIRRRRGVFEGRQCIRTIFIGLDFHSLKRDLGELRKVVEKKHARASVPIIKMFRKSRDPLLPPGQHAVIAANGDVHFTLRLGGPGHAESPVYRPK